MLFNTPQYALFLLVVFALFWAVSQRLRLAHALLLLASYFFYGCWNVRYLALILFVTALNYVTGVLMRREERQGRRKLYLVISLVGSLGVLGVFKYYGFFTTELSDSLRLFGIELLIPQLKVLLPVGISLYTFQALSYTIDLYRGEIEPCDSFADFALFVAFFPQLVAGPIVRAKQFLPQLKTKKQYSDGMVSSGLFQILRGLVKKIVFADFLGMHLVDGVFADPIAHGSLTTLLAVYGYAFQIYGDFAGYSDIAIGSARMLGFELPINFDGPYKSLDLREFWQRWHISLSTWLRDYLYIPLGGSRKGGNRTYVNLMITMFLGGIWHGAAYTFVFWGIYHGALLGVTRVFQRRFGQSERTAWTPAISFLKWIVTFHLACFGWIMFRVRNISDVGVIMERIVHAGDWSVTVPGGVLVVLALAFVTHMCPRKLTDGLETLFVRMPAPAQGFALAVMLALFNLFKSAANPFIYFQF
jgi:D-alanyl-lipoteichoic acid acyltransferase DltB (MBOAT superfamily)